MLKRCEALKPTGMGGHPHKRWGLTGPPGDRQFAEAAYPKALCETISECLKLRARALGYELDALQLPNDSASRRAAQKQARGKIHQPVMPEFHYTHTVTSQLVPYLCSTPSLCWSNLSAMCLCIAS